MRLMLSGCSGNGKEGINRMAEWPDYWLKVYVSENLVTAQVRRDKNVRWPLVLYLHMDFITLSLD